MLSTHFFSRFTWRWKKKSLKSKHTPHFNDFAGQTIYSSIMQPIYISQIPPVQSTKHTLTHLQLAINSWKQDPKRFPPTKSCVYQASEAPSHRNIRMINLKPEEEFSREIIQLHFLYIFLKARKLAQHGHIN